MTVQKTFMMRDLLNATKQYHAQRRDPCQTFHESDGETDCDKSIDELLQQNNMIHSSSQVPDEKTTNATNTKEEAI